MSFRTKLIALFAALAIVPPLTIGGIGVIQLAIGAKQVTCDRT